MDLVNTTKLNKYCLLDDHNLHNIDFFISFRITSTFSFHWQVGDRLFSAFGQDTIDALFWTATEPTLRKREHIGVIPHLLVPNFCCIYHFFGIKLCFIHHFWYLYLFGTVSVILHPPKGPIGNLNKELSLL